MVLRLHGIDDLGRSGIDGILARAGELADGSAPQRVTTVLGLAFFDASLRTRVGFSAAAHRVGAHPIEILERRSSDRSMPESVEDTIRTVSGYCDALIVRSAVPSGELSASARDDRAWINAGDDREHPTQSLIDLFAIERLAGPIEQQRVVLVGDIRMRAAQSLLRAFLHRTPRSVSIDTDPTLEGGLRLPGALDLSRSRDGSALDDATVVVAVGVPHGAASESVRARLRVDRRTLGRLGPEAIVLSPMPVIDEVAMTARTDQRMAYFAQSDLGLWVRVAVLEELLRTTP